MRDGGYCAQACKIILTVDYPPDLVIPAPTGKGPNAPDGQPHWENFKLDPGGMPKW